MFIFLSVHCSHLKQDSVQTHRKTPAEDTETHTVIKMEFIKEESEDMKIEETFRVKHEETETHTG